MNTATKNTLTLLAFLLLFIASGVKGQNSQLSLSGTYGIIVSDNRPEKTFKSFGASLGLELKMGKHSSVGGDLDWQRLESELAVAFAPTSPNLPNLPYSIDYHQFNIRPTFRYYFKETFRGLYLGVFGTYTYLTVKTSAYPKDPGYFPDLYVDPSDDFGLGGGLTYGYRLKLTSSLQVSAFGSHQLFWNDSPKYQQQDHQFGLGLNWTI